MRSFYRIERLPPYVFNIVNELKTRARSQGEDIIDFGMGNPDLATPPHIVDKLVEAAGKPRNHRYSASRGITKLRAAIADWYRRRYDVRIDPETEAIATIGVKEGLSHLALAIVEPGDMALVPNPTYPIHTYSMIIAGANVRSVPLIRGGDFFKLIEAAYRETWPRPTSPCPVVSAQSDLRNGRPGVLLPGGGLCAGERHHRHSRFCLLRSHL